MRWVHTIHDPQSTLILQDSHKEFTLGTLTVCLFCSPRSVLLRHLKKCMVQKGNYFSVMLIIAAEAEPVSRYELGGGGGGGLVKILLLNSWAKLLIPALQNRGGLHSFPTTKNLLFTRGWLINTSGKSIFIRPITLKLPGRGGKTTYKPRPYIQGNDLLWQNICSFCGARLCFQNRSPAKRQDGTFMEVRCKGYSWIKS